MGEILAVIMSIELADMELRKLSRSGLNNKIRDAI
jgi:hypothetical protein